MRQFGANSCFDSLNWGVVGAIVAFANNSRLVDNSQELKDNVRDKHFLIDKR